MTYKEILDHYKKVELVQSTASILHWDMETFLPENSGQIRGEQLSFLSGLHHDLFTQKDFVEAVLSCEINESTPEGKQIKRLKTSVAKIESLPKRLAEELSAAEVGTIGRWKEARLKNDFSLVKEELKSMLSLQREKAQCYAGSSSLKQYYGDRNHYEILLDDFEPGMLASEIKGLLSTLVEETKLRLDKIISKSPKSVKKFAMSEEKQLELNRKIAADLGFDFTRGRMDKSVHPFCGGSPQDVRITTRYFENNFLEGMTGTIHETGHALYESGLPEDFYYTPCGQACSNGTHESQSRFYENCIARSKPFSDYLSKLVNEDASEIYQSLNQVKKSFIRVESDEVSYNLHIALRMELEEKMILGELEVEDLPSAWNSLFESYFGMKPSSDLEGCLQDTHWFGGAFGYFPTYSIGNLLAAELFEDFQKEIPDWAGKVRAGNFSFIREFMHERLHKHASFHDSPETVSLALNGRPLGVSAFIQYLDRKYL